MEVNNRGVFTDLTFWKLGCNWGSGQPSFYKELRNRNIVIGYQDVGIYNMGDLVLIGEGHNIIALALVKSQAIAINTNTNLVDVFKVYNVNELDKVAYYNVEFYEIPKKETFKYELQQGIVRVHKEHVKKNATQCWLKNPNYLDKRIMRLTWNTNNWESPSGHPWREKNQNNSSIAYENQYGFGHEEWLFNERFRINGYQYGYIRGVNNLSPNKELIDQITLYTIRDDKQRCLVGNLNNVEIIEGYQKEQDKIQDLLSFWHQDMIDELKAVNADYEHFKTDQLLPNVKFKWDLAEIFQNPIPVDFLNGAKFNRFQAYYLKDELFEPIQKEIEEQNVFKFQSGKAANTAEYTTSTVRKKNIVKRRHGQITDDLYNYLIHKGNETNNISVEKTRVGSSIVDVALKTKDGFELFEVKTSNTALANIRQALGQIVEYALLDGETKCTKLVIIGPAKLRDFEKDYILRLKELINITLSYWEYNADAETIENRFISE